MSSFAPSPAKPSAYIQTELDLIASISNLTIKVQTASFLTVTIQETKWRSINATLTFPPDYPLSPVLPTINNTGIKGSLSIPPHLKKHIESQIDTLLTKHPPPTNATSTPTSSTSQLYLLLAHLSSFIATNLFFPCWKELRTLTSFLTTSTTPTFTPTIKTSATAGKIIITLTAPPYHFNFSLAVDPGYPGTLATNVDPLAIALTTTSSNLPPFLVTIITAQATEVVRRCYQGRTPSSAVRMSNPIRVPREFTDKVEAREVLDRNTLKDMQRDVNTIKTVKQLESVNSNKVVDGHRGKVFENSAKDRQDARRNLKKLAIAEMTADQTQSQQQLDKAREAAKHNQEGYEEFETDPQPCLNVVVEFLVDSIKKVRGETCGVCHAPVLHDNPAVYGMTAKKADESAADKKLRKSLKDIKPLRVHCGHFYHAKCLDDFMTDPPFGKECGVEGCSRPVFYTGYPDDKAVLERNYSNRQARIREVEDAAVLF